MVKDHSDSENENDDENGFEIWNSHFVDVYNTLTIMRSTRHFFFFSSFSHFYHNWYHNWYCKNIGIYYFICVILNN